MDKEMLTYFKNALELGLKEVFPAMRWKFMGPADVLGHQDPMDEIDQTSKRSEHELMRQMQRRNERLIHEIQEALYRLKRGDFGICEECGRDIEMARLKAQPMTTMCLACKREWEILEKRKVA